MRVGLDLDFLLIIPMYFSDFAMTLFLLSSPQSLTVTNSPTPPSPAYRISASFMSSIPCIMIVRTWFTSSTSRLAHRIPIALRIHIFRYSSVHMTYSLSLYWFRHRMDFSCRPVILEDSGEFGTYVLLGVDTLQSQMKKDNVSGTQTHGGSIKNSQEHKLN